MEMEIHKNMLTGETEIKTYSIFICVERESVCMGDDCYAPHIKKIFLEKSDKLSDFLNILMKSDFLPCSYVWTIYEDNKILGYINDSNGKPKYELAIPDDYIYNLKIKSVYCQARR